MIIGKYIRTILEEGERVILPGFGNLEVFVPEGAHIPSGNRLNPPGTSVKFDAGFSKDDGVLANAMTAGEEIDKEEAGQRVLELVDAIKFSLDKGEDYMLPDAGTFSRDDDGKIHFQADPEWVLEPDQYGLESMDLLELDELPIEEAPVKAIKKDPKVKKDVTVLTPPKPKPRPESSKWRLIWIVAAALLVVLAVLILIPSKDPETGKRNKLFSGKADREIVDQEESVDPRAAETETQEADSDAEPAVTVVEEEKPQPVEEINNYFIIAGSFNKLKNASDLQDKLVKRGFKSEVMITENRMYRVSVAAYPGKKEAETGLAQIKTEPGLQSCWLLSN